MEFDELFDTIYVNVNELKEKNEKMKDTNDIDKVRQLDIMVGATLLFFDKNIKTL